MRRRIGKENKFRVRNGRVCSTFEPRLFRINIPIGLCLRFERFVYTLLASVALRYWEGGEGGEGAGGGGVMDDETLVSKESRYRSRGNDIPAYSSASTSSRRHVATDSKETSRVVSEISPGTVSFEIFTRPWARYSRKKAKAIAFLFHLFIFVPRDIFFTSPAL